MQKKKINLNLQFNVIVVVVVAAALLISAIADSDQLSALMASHVDYIHVNT